MADLSAYGLTASTGGGGSLSFDAEGVIASKMPSFVSALESASETVSGGVAAIVGGLDAAADVATVVAPDVAASISAASAEATAIGVSSVTGPLAPFGAAVIAGVALIESNLASGGTGCCGMRPYTPAEAAYRWLFTHGQINLLTGQQVGNYKPTDEDVRPIRLYSGYGSDAPPCDPGEYKWDALFPEAKIVRTPGSPEAFIEGVLRAAYESRAGCWTDYDKLNAALPGILAGAVKAWNNTHFSTSVRTVSVSPGDSGQNPIPVAVAQLRSMAGQADAPITFVVNTGLYVHPAIGRVTNPVVSGFASSLKGKVIGTPMITDPVAVSFNQQSFLADAYGNAAPSVAVSAPRPAAPATSTSFLSKKVVGNVSVGEVGIGAVAIAAVTKFMGMW